ncbi:Ankyrin repeat-containing protein ITN1, partial [Mucuna pruriens]
GPYNGLWQHCHNLDHKRRSFALQNFASLFAPRPEEHIPINVESATAIELVYRNRTDASPRLNHALRHTWILKKIMAMQISSKKFDRAPSIRQLFPPKNLEESNDKCSFQVINHQCYSSKPLLLEDVAPSPRNFLSSIPSNAIEHAVSIYQPVDRSSTSAISSEPSSSLFPPLSNFNVPIVHYLQTVLIFNVCMAGDKIPMDLHMYLPLYRAALKGDWEKANEFLNLHPGAEHARISRGWETALHISAGARHAKFVEELVKRMNTSGLEIQNKDNNTALCFAAASGVIKIAKLMVERNINLPGIRGSERVTPLYIATLLGHRDMVWYLYSVTNHEILNTEDYFSLLIAAISTDLYDFALHVLECRPQLATYHGLNGETALHVLAKKPSSFTSGIQVKLTTDYRCQPNNSQSQASSTFQDNLLVTGLCQAVKYLVPGFKKVQKKKILNAQALKLVQHLWELIVSSEEIQHGDLIKSPLSRPLFIAAEFGIPEIVIEILYSYPDLLWKVDGQNRSLFHIAIMYRQEKIFNLIYDIGAHKDLITSYRDNKNHNILHLAGKLAPSDQLHVVSGAALQMQRELLWFKEVEKIIQPLLKEIKDSEGRTPQMLFTEEHKGLAKEGEKWLKNTASSCMLVATLITTVMFAAIFTVPGGNNNNNGYPIFMHTTSFKVFALSDALALFSSVISILMFLSILTSRYAQEDFLVSLPKRLSVGIASLFFSIITMLIAFGATFFIVLGHQLAWIFIPTTLVACIPAILFAFLQFPLLVDTISCTYGAGVFAR